MTGLKLKSTLLTICVALILMPQVWHSFFTKEGRESWCFKGRVNKSHGTWNYSEMVPNQQGHLISSPL